MKQNADMNTLLGYQIQKANLLMMADARATLEPYGMTPAKLTALMLVSVNPGCDQTALGKALSINRSSAMKLVNGLATRGLVERRPGRNLRTNALHLLPQGETQLKDMVARLHATDRRISDRLDPAELATLLVLLRKLGQPPKQRHDAG